VVRDANGAPVVAPSPAGVHDAEISAGQRVRTNHGTAEVFGDGQTDVLKGLWELSQALGANDQAGIAAAAGTLDAAENAVQRLVGDVGSRANQLEVTRANLDALEVNLRTFKSDLEEVDFERAVTELVTRQTAYQAAMLATSRVLGLNLADYLR
jgi:flagellar hook-associated protein 3 FlgL